MTDSSWDSIGFKADAPRITRELPGAVRRFGGSEPAFRKRELFPVRYDARPLYLRAMERRVAR